MKLMMKYVSFQRPIEQWDVSKIRDMSYIFSLKSDVDDWLYYDDPPPYCDPNIADWDVSRVTDFVSGCFIKIAKNFIL